MQIKFKFKLKLKLYIGHFLLVSASKAKKGLAPEVCCEYLPKRHFFFLGLAIKFMGWSFKSLHMPVVANVYQ